MNKVWETMFGAKLSNTALKVYVGQRRLHWQALSPVACLHIQEFSVGYTDKYSYGKQKPYANKYYSWG